MSDVKAKILEVKGVEPASQVLICAGKTLQDSAKLSDSVSPKGFLVLMVKVSKRASSFSPNLTEYYSTVQRPDKYIFIRRISHYP